MMAEDIVERKFIGKRYCEAGEQFARIVYFDSSPGSVSPSVGPSNYISFEEDYVRNSSIYDERTPASRLFVSRDHCLSIIYRQNRIEQPLPRNANGWFEVF